ncbi:MAG: hypothetical protein ACOC06_02070 [Halorubrum sp.]
MIDEHGTDDSGQNAESRQVLLSPLANRVPGAAANAPKRNVLVALAYLLSCALAVGALLPAL